MKSALIRKRSSIALVSLLAFAIAGLPSAAGAAAGDLDPSFGVGGKGRHRLRRRPGRR